MNERNTEASVYDYLVLEKAYPKSEILLEAVIGSGSEGRACRADLAIIDSRRSEIIALIEVKGSRDHKALRSAISQLLQYRRILGKPHIPLYLFFSTSFRLWPPVRHLTNSPRRRHEGSFSR
ncbi:MAG: hypothetical protein HKL84_09505 [Acidimicrobiaceae bacterium]|nr:hypothetical protein [Acidimicrobiaceae bacterium]